MFCTPPQEARATAAHPGRDVDLTAIAAYKRPLSARRRDFL